MPASQGEFYATIVDLLPGTTYYYRAALQVGEQDFYGDVLSFTTASAPATIGQGWLELPAISNPSNTRSLWVGGARNYTYLYDTSMYTALWTAYPLYSSVCTGSSGTPSWKYNPYVDNQYQIDVENNSYGTNYGGSAYSRGHQLPDADRDGNIEMKRQAYYLTNQTPQLQNKFNGSIWSQLEGAVRTVACATDTVYVVTGASFRKAGGSETISYLHSASVTPASVPIPNYYWKVLLKVKRSGSTVTSASAVGFWLEHKEYTGDSYANYAVSVDQIEAWTGFNFFANLPASVESSAESNSSWTSFQNF